MQEAGDPSQGDEYGEQRRRTRLSSRRSQEGVARCGRGGACREGHRRLHAAWLRQARRRLPRCPAHHFKDARALLTAFAVEGFERFIATMRGRQEEVTDARDRLTAAGLGYIDFALANPALFRLMFSSSRPDFGDVALEQASSSAFAVLTDAVCEARGADPAEDGRAMLDVAASWSIVHGPAELLLSGRTSFLAALAGEDPDAIYAEIIRRMTER